MTLKLWRKAIHNLIVAMGFMALIAIMTGASASNSMSRGSFDQGLLGPEKLTPSPLWVRECNRKQWIDEVVGQNRNGYEICPIKEDHHEHSKRLTLNER